MHAEVCPENLKGNLLGDLDIHWRIVKKEGKRV
jgi:hypothetical protein